MGTANFAEMQRSTPYVLMGVAIIRKGVILKKLNTFPMLIARFNWFILLRFVKFIDIKIKSSYNSNDDKIF